MSMVWGGVAQITLRLHLNKMILRWNFKSIVTDTSNLLGLKDLWTDFKFLPLHSSFFVSLLTNCGGFQITLNYYESFEIIPQNPFPKSNFLIQIQLNFLCFH